MTELPPAQPQYIGNIPTPMTVEEMFGDAPLQENVMDWIAERCRRIAIRIGGVDYFNVHELACAIRVPSIHIIKAVRDGHLPGRKIGKAYIITSESFYQFITSDNFNFTQRIKPVKEDVAHVESQTKTFLAWALRYDMRQVSEEEDE